MNFKKQSIRNLLFCWVLIVLTLNSVKAQAIFDSLGKTIELAPLSIESSRLETLESRFPMAVSVIEETRLQKGQPQLSIKDAMDAIPGVFALNAENYAQDVRISIRGFGARAAFGIRGIKVIVDGIPESTPDGQAQIDNLDIGMVERLEVLRGPSSTLYGNAAGGVLNFVTETVDSPFSEFRTTAGSYGLKRYQMKTGIIPSDKISSMFYVSHTGIDGYRNHSQTSNTLLNNKTVYKPDSATTFKVLLNYMSSPEANDPGGVTLEEVRSDRVQGRDLNIDQETGEQVRQGRGGIVFEHQFGKNHAVKANVYHTFRNFDGTIPFAIIRFDRSYTGGGLSYRYRRSFGQSTYRLIMGSDLAQQVDDRKNFDNDSGEQGNLILDQEERYGSIGTYLIQEYSPFPKLAFSMGLRYDQVVLKANDQFLTDGDDSGSRHYQQLNPMAGILYQPSPQISFFSNYSRSFETPTLSELANPNIGGFNPNVRPQLANSFEIGARGWVNDIFHFEVTGFHLRIKDELVPYEVPEFPDREFYRNAGKSERNGIEVGFGFQPNDLIRSFLTYTYSDFSYADFSIQGTDFTGNDLPGIPDHTLYHELRITPPFNTYLIVQSRYVGSMYADNTNSTKIDPYYLVNLRLGHVFDTNQWQLEPYAGINNLLNAKYNSNIRINAFGGRYYEPAPLINYFVGLRARIGW